MANFNITESLTVANNTTTTLDVDNLVLYYVVSGTATLSTGNYTISTSSSPTDGKLFYIWYKGRVTYGGGYVVNILGTAFTQQEALSDSLIIVKGNGADFDIVVLKDDLDFYLPYKGVDTYATVLAGGTLTLEPKLDKKVQIITGSGSMSGSSTITATAETVGDEFLIIYNATLTLGANSYTIFGISLTAEEAASGDLSILTSYDGAAWQTSMMKGQSLVPDRATQAQAETGSNNTTYTTPLRVSQYVAAWLLAGAKSTSQIWTFSNATPINLSALTANQTLELDGSKNITSVAKQDAYNAAFGTTAGTVTEGDDTRVANDSFVLYGSFVTGEVGAIGFDMQHAITVTSAYIRVTGTLSGTDDGTITLSKGGSAITGGSQVIPLSTPFGTDYTLSLSGPNASFVVGDELRYTTSKTTSGGKIMIVVYYTKD